MRRTEQGLSYERGGETVSLRVKVQRRQSRKRGKEGKGREERGNEKPKVESEGNREGSEPVSNGGRIQARGKGEG